MKEQKEIKIQVPDGYEIDTQQSTFEKIVFKEIEQELTYNIIAQKLFATKHTFWTQRDGDIVNCVLFGESVYHNNNSTTKEQLESILALNKLCNVARYLNGDWLPEDEQIAYFISNGPDELTIFYHITVRYSVVYFKTKELAQQAIEILGEEEIRKALTLNW